MIFIGVILLGLRCLSDVCSAPQTPLQRLHQGY